MNFMDIYTCNDLKTFIASAFLMLDMAVFYTELGLTSFGQSKI